MSSRSSGGWKAGTPMWEGLVPPKASFTGWHEATSDFCALMAFPLCVAISSDKDTSQIG